MDEMFLIKNKDDYDEYSKLKPSKVYARKKVKFICSNCNKESIKTFRYLTRDLLCRTCTCSNAQKNDAVRLKIKNTCISKYGTENVFQNEAIKEKIKETNIRLYGHSNVANSEVIKHKKRETNLKKYGVKYPAQSDIVKTKQANTILERYGVINAMQCESIKQKQKESRNSNWINEYSEKLTDMTIVSNVVDGYITLKCLKCNKEFKLSETIFYLRLRNNTLQCPLCTLKTHIIHSHYEDELYNFITGIYTGTVLINDRQVLDGKEIDIYLPEKKIGFEFDGTYWHADPRFYNETDIIIDKPAKEIWEKDIEKTILAESKGIKIIRILEYDWVNNNTVVKDYINTILK